MCAAGKSQLKQREDTLINNSFGVTRFLKDYKSCV